MKKFIAIAALFALQSISAQITKNVGDFDQLRIFDRINVELIPSDENKVEITGKRSKDVEVINKNGELKIRMRLEKLLDGEDINARVYFKNLRGIDANEGSFIGCGEPFRQNTIELTAKSGGEVKVALEVEKADIKVVTGGIIRVNGSATTLEADLGTGGILRAKELQTSRTEIDIKAGGEADIYATDYVDADVKAGGTVTIFGRPKEIDEKTTLGGTIRESK